MVIFSPYRICPLGAHIDHQLGVVLGTALKDMGIYFTWKENGSGNVRLVSANYKQGAGFPLGGIPLRKEGYWSDYAKGAVYVLKREWGVSRGIDGVVRANFPGGGLASSAAVSIAYLLALEKANQITASPEKNIKLVRDIENDYIGLKSGILDQSMILLSESIPNSMVFLDSKTLQHRVIVPERKVDFEVAVVYSGVGQAITMTDYNKRVAECREAAGSLLEKGGARLPRRKTARNDNEYMLRDVPREVFEQYGKKLPSNLRKRATHFFTETARVKKGAALWKKGDMEGFGKLVTESGKSSIVNYECGSPPLIEIYELLNSIKGVYGARFSGAGFRGSCIGFIEPSTDVRCSIKEALKKRYAEKFPSHAKKYRVDFSQTGGGARFLRETP